MGVHVRVLGTVQDGGVPHAGCACPTCTAARHDPVQRRRVASIAIVGASGRALVVDATPDFTEQIARLGVALRCGGPCLDGLVLTHGHMGHYVGLAMLGREGMNARRLPVWCTATMATFLRENKPWSYLIERGQIELRGIEPDETVRFDGARVTPFLAPHRGEDTDTIGVVVGGIERRLLYVPDTDRLTDDLVARIRRVDVALIDGTFYGPAELPGRNIGEVPHPFVEESVRRLAGTAGQVHFTHLNHTNPLIHPSPDVRPQLPPGFDVLAENAVFPL